jgi:hypothetical protein
VTREAYKAVIGKYEGKTQFERPRLGGRTMKWLLKKIGMELIN